MLSEMTSAQLTELMMYEREFGVFGPERGDLLHGMLVARVLSAVSGKSQQPDKHMPKWAGPTRQTGLQMEDIVKASLKRRSK